MNFQGFHVNASRLDFGEVTTLATVLSQHAALSGADVPEITLSRNPVGAPLLWDNFSRLDAMSKYITISLTSGALVSETTVCVTFGARRRSRPGRLLECLWAILAAKVAHGIRNGCCW